MFPGELRQTIMQQAQGALLLNIAYIGVVNGLFSQIEARGQASAPSLAEATSMNAGYVMRWLDAAYAFGLVEESAPDSFALSDLGRAFLPDQPGSLMPFAVQAVLSAHMSERAAGLMRTGERPGESVLAERETILPWFGPMLEYQFGPLLEREILPNLKAYQEVAARGGLAIDLGCGNGWYLRALCRNFPGLRGLGLDGFAENIDQATACAETAGLRERLRFAQGDIYEFNSDEPADLIAMNRALHHVWDEKDTVFGILRDQLKPGGVAVIWEPAWPERRGDLRDPARRPMAFQNLSEHVQGNHFLHPEEIAAAFEAVGLEPEVHLFVNGREAVVTGRRPATA